MNNFIILVLDGCGIGELPDAAKYGDSGSNTIANTAEKAGGIDLPNLEKLGLGNIHPVKGVKKVAEPMGSFGKMAEVSAGKDSTTGHWEIAGLIIKKDFEYYPDGFPQEMMEKFMELTGMKGYLGNKAASGTEIIKELGEEHIRTGFPIVYTSADSVFQIAAHEQYFGLEKLYEVCDITRNKVLAGHNIGRVIARPFIGEPGNFTRTTNRHDYSLDAPGETLVDLLFRNGINTVSVGKVDDLFNGRGINIKYKTKSNLEGIARTADVIRKYKSSLIFTNLLDFDVYYGHRNDPAGFANALREFDENLPAILDALDETDVLVITADHGNDPTSNSSDHSREYVPLIVYSKQAESADLGVRATFADIGKSAADFFDIENSLDGTSFLGR
ncbi:MAG: phosphopentomutase [Ignavibacteriaceae bacterium]|nr:phosphopentomutase [Ignavibacteriaceae bacterium]